MKQIPKIEGSSFSQARRLLREGMVSYHIAALQQYGDIVECVVPNNLIICGHPDFAKHVLIQKANNYFEKDVNSLQTLEAVGGTGIITSNDYSLWKKNRSIAKRFFYPNKFKEYVPQLVQNTQDIMTVFEEAVKNKTPLLFDSLLAEITIKNVLTTIIRDITTDHQIYSEALHNILVLTIEKTYSVTKILWTLPTPQKILLDHSLQIVHRTVEVMIQSRLNQSDFGDDYLGVFLKAYADEPDRNKALKQIHGEISTILAAGHETTASTLGWVLANLSRHPEVERKLRLEIETVLNGREITYEDIANLHYTQAVIAENLRLHPNVPLLSPRISKEDDEMLGYLIPKNSAVAVSIYYIQRHPDFWENPQGFDPERFIKNPWYQQTRCGFIPGGIGERHCLGLQYGVLEMVVILTTWLQKYRFTLPPWKVVQPHGTALLWIEGGLTMDIHRVPH